MEDFTYELTEYDKKMQKVYLELWEEFDRVAKEYNLRYFLFNGTLIGAARHKGFIPWDDDFDICMPRKDYDRLQYELSDKFREPFFFQSPLSDPTHFNGLNRLRKSDTTMILRYDYGHPCNNGVYMDIYPIDNLPNGEGARKRLYKKAKLFRQLFYYHVYGCLKPAQKVQPKMTLKQRGVRTLSKVLFSLFDEKRLYNYFQRKLGKYKDKATTHAATISVHPGRACNVWHTEDIAEVTYLEFEGREMPVPIGWDRCMTIRYGDYMKLPPEDKRKPIHCTKAYMNPDIPYTEVTWDPFENWD